MDKIFFVPGCTDQWKCIKFSWKQDFDEFNPLSNVSSCALVQIVRDQEKTARIA